MGRGFAEKATITAYLKGIAHMYPDEAKKQTNFDEEEVITTPGKLVQKHTLFEDLNEHILNLTEPENVENEIIEGFGGRRYDMYVSSYKMSKPCSPVRFSHRKKLQLIH